LNTISRYMYGRLILATLAVTTALGTMQVLEKSRDLYRLVVSNVISYSELLTLWGALLPVVLYHAGPEMVTLGVVARYYLWRQHNEILTQRSAGRSCWQIAFPGIATGASMCLFSAVMSLYALPATFGTAEDIGAAAEIRITPSMLEEGVENRVMPGVLISFKRWGSAETIEGIVMTNDRAPDEFVLVTAERGRFARIGTAYVLVLENGSSFTRSASGAVKHLMFKQLSVPLVAAAARNHARGYYEESIGRLLNPPAEVQKDPRLRSAWVSEGHHRIINPLRCISVVLVVLGVLVPGRQGNAELIVRLAAALGLSFGEGALATVVFAMAQRGVAAAPLLYLLPAASAALGALLLWAGDRPPKRRLPWPKSRRMGSRVGEASPSIGG
jgi:lipopolysaccharide export system permease protein